MRNKQYRSSRTARTHYKMYKSGKQWVFSGITLVALGVSGTLLCQKTAHADTTNGSEGDNYSQSYADSNSNLTTSNVSSTNVTTASSVASTLTKTKAKAKVKVATTKAKAKKVVKASAITTSATTKSSSSDAMSATLSTKMGSDSSDATTSVSSVTTASVVTSSSSSDFNLTSVQTSVNGSVSSVSDEVSSTTSSSSTTTNLFANNLTVTSSQSSTTSSSSATASSNSSDVTSAFVISNNAMTTVSDDADNNTSIAIASLVVSMQVASANPVILNSSNSAVDDDLSLRDGSDSNQATPAQLSTVASLNVSFYSTYAGVLDNMYEYGLDSVGTTVAQNTLYFSTLGSTIVSNAVSVTNNISNVSSKLGVSLTNDVLLSASNNLQQANSSYASLLSAYSNYAGQITNSLNTSSAEVLALLSVASSANANVGLGSDSLTSGAAVNYYINSLQNVLYLNAQDKTASGANAFISNETLLGNLLNVLSNSNNVRWTKPNGSTVALGSLFAGLNTLEGNFNSYEAIITSAYNSGINSYMTSVSSVLSQNASTYSKQLVSGNPDLATLQSAVSSLAGTSLLTRDSGFTSFASSVAGLSDINNSLGQALNSQYSFLQSSYTSFMTSQANIGSTYVNGFNSHYAFQTSLAAQFDSATIGGQASLATLENFTVMVNRIRTSLANKNSDTVQVFSRGLGPYTLDSGAYATSDLGNLDSLTANQTSTVAVLGSALGSVNSSASGILSSASSNYSQASSAYNSYSSDANSLASANSLANNNSANSYYNAIKSLIAGINLDSMNSLSAVASIGNSDVAGYASMTSNYNINASNYHSKYPTDSIISSAYVRTSTDLGIVNSTVPLVTSLYSDASGAYRYGTLSNGNTPVSYIVSQYNSLASKAAIDSANRDLNSLASDYSLANFLASSATPFFSYINSENSVAVSGTSLTSSAYNDAKNAFSDAALQYNNLLNGVSASPSSAGSSAGSSASSSAPSSAGSSAGSMAPSSVTSFASNNNPILPNGQNSDNNTNNGTGSYTPNTPSSASNDARNASDSATTAGNRLSAISSANSFMISELPDFTSDATITSSAFSLASSYANRYPGNSSIASYYARTSSDASGLNSVFSDASSAYQNANNAASLASGYVSAINSYASQASLAYGRGDYSGVASASNLASSAAFALNSATNTALSADNQIANDKFKADSYASDAATQFSLASSVAHSIDPANNSSANPLYSLTPDDHAKSASEYANGSSNGSGGSGSSFIINGSYVNHGGANQAATDASKFASIAASAASNAGADASSHPENSRAASDYARASNDAKSAVSAYSLASLDASIVNSAAKSASSAASIADSYSNVASGYNNQASSAASRGDFDGYTTNRRSADSAMSSYYAFSTAASSDAEVARKASLDADYQTSLASLYASDAVRATNDADEAVGKNKSTTNDDNYIKVYPYYGVRKGTGRLTIGTTTKTVKASQYPAFRFLGKVSQKGENVKIKVSYHGKTGYLTTKASNLLNLYYGMTNRIKAAKVKEYSHEHVIKKSILDRYVGKTVKTRKALLLHSKFDYQSDTDVKKVKAGKTFKIAKVMVKNGVSRFLLTNGHYLSANRQLVRVIK